MGTIVEAKNLADLYDLPLVDWAAVTIRLDAGASPILRSWPQWRSVGPRIGRAESTNRAWR